jgi:hypothetical protein
VTRSTSRRTAALAVLLSCALLPAGALTANASTEVVAAPLPAPTNLFPADSASNFPHTVRKGVALSWNEVAGASGYKVEIGRDNSWSAEKPIASFTTVNTALMLPVGLTYQSYVWRVAALKGSTLGHWSSEETHSQNDVQFTKGWRAKPTLVTPINGTQGIAAFQWTNVGEGAKYEFELAPPPAPNGSNPSATPDTTPAPEIQYDWTGDDVIRCKTARTRLSGFTLVPEVDSGFVTEQACDLSGLTVGTQYAWRVRAIDPAAEGDLLDESNFSTPTTFVLKADDSAAQPFDAHMETRSLDAEADDLCTVTNAATGAAEHADCLDVPTIRWAPVAGAVKYEVTLSLTDQVSPAILAVETTGTSFTTTTSWPEGSPSMSFYYDVRACVAVDADNKCTSGNGYTSTPRSFRKVTPRLTNLSTPSTRGRLAFSWNSYATQLAGSTTPARAVTAAPEDAKAYRLQVANASDQSYSSPVIDEKVDGQVTAAGVFTSTGGPTFLPKDNVLLNGSYRWRVQPVDSDGNLLPWSLSRTFTRDNTAPKLVSVTPSSKVASKAPLKLTFSEPVTGVSSSSISLTPAAPATVTVTTPTTATLTPTSGWLPGATYRILVGSAVQDLSGLTAANLGPTFAVNNLVDDANPAMAFSSGWRTLSSTNAVGGGFHSATATSTFKPSATVAFRGTAAFVRACMGPSNGYLDVYVDGVLKKHASLYRSFSGCGVVVANVTGLARANHTMKFVVTGQRVTASKGTTATIDAVNVTP